MIGSARLFARALVLAGVSCIGAACSRDAAAPSADHEVWIVDQADSPGVKYGGTVYVWPAAQLLGDSAAHAEPRLRIDLAGATTDLCRERTGAAPVRPHMIRFNDTGSHAIVAFVASGHTVFLDATSGAPVDCLRASLSASGQQAHAAYPTPGGRFVIVANQNGKRLERIETDYETNTFTHDSAAMLDLATCTTSAGTPCEAQHLRPDNAPVCPYMSADGLAFVTLRGGGLLVVDVRDRPMRIIAAYDSAHVKGNGCGGVEVDRHMYVNAGGRPGAIEHMHPYGFEVYRFDLEQLDPRAPAGAENSPAPEVIWSAAGAHDSHSMVVTGGERFVWALDRHADAAEVFETAGGRHVGTVHFNGPLTDNAAPDIAVAAPGADRIYVALRGPTPLSGDPHNATGTTPGLGIIDLDDGGRTGRLAAIVRITNEQNGVELADPHAVAVRLLR